MGFPVPWESWLRESLLGPIEGRLLEDRALDRGWLRADAVRDLVTRHRNGRMNAARQIWALWGLELWARLFLDGDREMVAAAGHAGQEASLPGTAMAV
jgi:asparagine synthase (glutamine-hydrolysing)